MTTNENAIKKSLLNKVVFTNISLFVWVFKSRQKNEKLITLFLLSTHQHRTHIRQTHTKQQMSLNYK